jgi:hypothetical protein
LARQRRKARSFCLAPWRIRVVPVGPLSAKLVVFALN